MNLAIVGMGTAVPATRLNLDEATRAAQAVCARNDHQARLLAAYFRLTEIETRHLAIAPEIIRDIIDGTNHTNHYFLPKPTEDDHGPTTRQRMDHYAENAPPLAIESSQKALTSADMAPGAITHLVTVSCTGFFAPGLDRALILGLGLSPTVQRTHVGFMGCHGAFNAMRVANAFTTSDPSARVLVCAVELCSLHYSYGWHTQQLLANALFADGSAAVVAVPEQVAPPDAWRMTGSGSCLFPNSADAMTWTIGDHGFTMTLSSQVPDLIMGHLKPWLERWLGEQGLTIGDVKSWGTHPGGPRILSFVQMALGLPMNVHEVSKRVLAEHGNMSSPTALFILDRLRSSDAPRPCVSMGFGPGLTAEAMLFR
jgi:prepilin-type processing-associated H-X9-DG protein